MLTAALNQAQPGDTVQLSRGEYRLTEALTPKSGVTLLGAGQGLTILRYEGTRPSALIDLSGRRNVRISALTLDAGNDPKANTAIYAHNASHLHLDHLTIQNAPGNGLGIHFVGDSPSQAHGVTDSVIEECRIENMGVGSEWGGGIRLSWGSSRNRILRNTISNTGRGGIFADNGSGDLIVRGNTVTGSHGDGLGLEIWGDCHRCVLEDNRLDHWLSISGCNRCAARRNVISDRSGIVKYIGIEVIGSDEVITDNVVDGGQEIGVSVSNDAPKDRVFWGYDRIARCVQWGAQLQGDKTGLDDQYFYRCRFAATGTIAGKPAYPGDAGHGFRINANAHRVVLDRCDVVDNRGLGIQVLGSDDAPAEELSFIACRILSNRGAASIWTGCRSLSWLDCVARGNGNDALPPARGARPEPETAEIEAPVEIRAGKPAAFHFRSPVARRDGPSVLWDFGDGIPQTTPAPEHVFAKPGRYRVTLLIWDRQGRSIHVEKRLTVR